MREVFDLRPAAIIRDLDLRRPIYAKTAAYGHFGRDDHDFTWERTDKAEALRAAAGVAAACGYDRLTNSPAAARSPTSRSSPFSPTVSWPADGCASRTSISVPGTSPWS